MGFHCHRFRTKLVIHFKIKFTTMAKVQLKSDNHTPSIDFYWCPLKLSDNINRVGGKRSSFLLSRFSLEVPPCLYKQKHPSFSPKWQHSLQHEPKCQQRQYGVKSRVTTSKFRVILTSKNCIRESLEDYQQ